jgi:hypothetical protein
MYQIFETFHLLAAGLNDRGGLRGNFGNARAGVFQDSLGSNESLVGLIQGRAPLLEHGPDLVDHGTDLSYQGFRSLRQRRYSRVHLSRHSIQRNRHAGLQHKRDADQRDGDRDHDPKNVVRHVHESLLCVD